MIKLETSNPPKITIRNITESEIMQVPGYIREYQKYIVFDTDLPACNEYNYELIRLDKDLWIVTDEVANTTVICDHDDLCEFLLINDYNVDEIELNIERLLYRKCMQWEEMSTNKYFEEVYGISKIPLNTTVFWGVIGDPQASNTMEPDTFIDLLKNYPEYSIDDIEETFLIFVKRE